MDEFYDSWADEDDTYTDENGIPYWELEEREEEYRVWENRNEERD